MFRVALKAQALAAAGTLAGALLLGMLPGTVMAVGAVSHYVFSPSPIAPAASLAASTTKLVTVSAEDSTNTLVPGAVIYLSISTTTGGGSAMVGTVALTSTPVAFTATTGSISISYKTPAVLPTGGKDILKAANLKSLATITASDIYSFSHVTKYIFVPNPIAVPGTLAAGAAVNVTLTSYNSSSVAVGGATVYLSFKQATGGGSAAVGTTTLTSTPVPFKANSLGQIAIVYHAPAVLPASGSDSIVATDATKNATISKTDNYSFAALHSLAFTPTPIAATATLKAFTKVSVTLTARDAFGNVVAGQPVYLTFIPTTGGGTATVGSKVLSATPSKLVTSSSGTIVVTYTTPATLPTTGTDTLHAANTLSSPTITATDGYTF